MRKSNSKIEKGGVDETREEEESTPSKIAKSQLSFSERKQRKDGNQQPEQVIILGQRIIKLENKLQQEKRDQIKMVLTFFVLLFLGYFAITYQEFSEIKGYHKELQQLQSKSLQWQKQFEYLEKIIISLREEIDTLHTYTEKLANEIIDIHANQLSKPEKSMQFLQKYSTPFNIKFAKEVNSFKKNYRFYEKDQNKIRKMSNEEIIAYSAEPIRQKNIFYFKVKIDYTQLGMISVGVFTEAKLQKNIDCGYCQSNQMYYMFCKNANIYHGSSFFMDNSKKSRINNVKAGDIITLFVDREENQLIWYVNNKYAQMMYTENAGPLYPFILMTTRGDEITILS